MKTSLLILTTIVVFWNLENFYDYRSDAARQKNWSATRFYAKCNGVAKTLLLCAEKAAGIDGQQLHIPDIVAVAEVENAFVLKRLVWSTSLRKLDYKIVHYDSPDRRGIDCGLLYRSGRFTLLSSKPCHIYEQDGSIMATRDILLTVFGTVEGDTLAVLVNHHPSKLGGGKEARRKAAMARLNELCDSLQARGIKHILSVGDFNDNVWDANLPGTIKYNGAWERIDGHFSSGLEVRDTVMYFPQLLTRDKGFGGLKPLRTYSGPRYLGGISDHLPVVFSLPYF